MSGWAAVGTEPFLVRKSPDVSKKFPPLSLSLSIPPLRSDLRGRTFFGVGLFAAKETSQRQVCGKIVLVVAFLEMKYRGK